jgi:hypothetical protein
MKPTNLIPLIPAINNGWAFAAFIIAIAVWLYLRERGEL